MINLADAFERVVDRIPEREAVACSTRRLTYRQLDERSNRLAHWLTEHGVSAGDDVAIFARNGSEYLEAMLAAFKIRAVPINVNYRYRGDELRYLLADSGPKAVVVDAEFEPALTAVAPELGAIAVGAPYEAALKSQPPERPDGARSPDDHYVLYTGGTTGFPKGVVWRHGDLFAAALAPPGLTTTKDLDEIAAAAANGGRGRLLVLSPLMHGAAHWGALTTFFSGNTLILDDPAGFDAARAVRLIRREGVTALGIVGDAFARPLADILADGTVSVPTLRAVVSGGAVLSETVQEDLRRACPGLRVVNGYGSSETGVQGQAEGTCDGRPRFMVGPETAVLDDTFEPVTPGSGRVGKLARRGRTPLAYRNDPEATARTFPIIDGERWAVTGDDAIVADDNSVVLLGRGATCINTGGEKVYPDEVAAVLKRHPAILEAIVVSVPHDRFGEQVTAIVQVRTGRTFEIDELQLHVRRHLADFKIPRRVTPVAAMERTPAGKIDLAWARRVALDAGSA